MKFSNLIIVSLFILSIISCDKEDNDDDLNNNNPTTEQPVLDFTINISDNYAPATISTENLTTGYSGNYKWIIQPDQIVSEEFNSSDITYTAEYPGDYNVTLIAGTDTLTKKFSLNAPTYVEIDKLTLKNVSNSYNSIYFVLKKYENSSLTTLFTSNVRNNVTPSSVSSGNEYWTFQSPFNQFEIQNTYGGPAYFIEFYDENNNIISKLNPYTPTYLSSYDRYTEEQITLATSNITCSGCDYLEVTANISFTNY